MKALLIEDIDYETVEKISNCTEKTMLLINSRGGNGACSMAIIDILRDTPDKFVLIACQDVYSAAFEIFFADHGCKRIVYPLCTGMYHLATQSLYHYSNGTMPKPTKKYHEGQPVILEGQINLMRRVGVSQEVMDLFLTGEDIEFSAKEMQEMLDFINQTTHPDGL